MAKAPRKRQRPAKRASKQVPPRARAQGAVVEGLRLLNQSRSAAQKMVRDAFENAQETLDGLEALFQKRVERAMHQLGVPTAAEIRVLSQRVAQLNETVQRLDARGRKSAGTRRRTKQ